MSGDGIEEIIASANDLLASVRRDFYIPPAENINTSSGLTVSPEVQRRIDNIVRYLQDIPEELDSASGTTTTNNEDNIQIVGSTNASGTPTSRGNEHAEVVDIIDLCSDTPEQSSVRRARNARHSGLTEVVDLVNSPISNFPVLPRNTLRRRAIFTTESNEAHATPDKRARTLASEMICAICMEPYASNHPTTTKCGHIFCGSCIVQSLKIKPICPICRAKIHPRTLIRIHF